MTRDEYKKYCINAEFIHNEMQFYSYADFLNNAKWIKRLYDKLDMNGKRMYMWYLFSKRYISLSQVSYIWDILNGIEECPEEDLEYDILEYFN